MPLDRSRALNGEDQREENVARVDEERGPGKPGRRSSFPSIGLEVTIEFPLGDILPESIPVALLRLEQSLEDMFAESLADHLVLFEFGHRFTEGRR